jgi:hypothetical protein
MDEITQEQFFDHLNKLFDGAETRPVTYTYPTEVVHNFSGNHISDEAFETFKPARPPEGHLEYISTGQIGSCSKEQTILSLRDFFANQDGVRFFFGEGHLSAWAFIE